MTKPLTLTEVQQQIAAWEKEMGWTEQSPMECAFYMTEELGELCKAIRCLTSNFDPTKPKDADVAGELADVLNYLAAIANRFDIDLSQAFNEKMATNKKRTWKKVD